MKRFSVLLTLCLCLAGCGLAGGVDKQLQRGKAALERGDYGEAVVLFRDLSDRRPQDGGIWLLLARALFQQGDIAAAERARQAAVEHGAPPQDLAELELQWRIAAGDYPFVLDRTDNEAVPLDARARRYYRARALQGLRRIPEALTIYHELAQQQDSADLQLRIAQCHAFHGRERLALRALRAAPGSAEGWLLRMTLARRQGDRAAEKEALRKAIETAPGQLTAPQQAEILAAAVDQALRAGDVTEAREYYSKLASLAPQAPVTRMVAGQIRLFDAPDTELIADLRRLTQEQPDNAPVRGMLIAALLRAGVLEQALLEANALASQVPDREEPKRLQQAIRNAADQPADSVTRQLALADAFTALQQPVLAREHLRDAVQAHPDARGLRAALAQLEIATGRGTEALKLMQPIVGSTPEPAMLMVLAGAQSASADHAAAVATYERLWAASPSGPLAIALTQARYRAAVKDPEEPLREWLRDHPRDVAVRMELAMALQRTGDHAGAAEHYRRVLAQVSAGATVRSVALNNLAEAYARLDDPRALETARAAYEEAKEWPPVQDTYGWQLVKAGRAAEALPLLQAAAEAVPTAAAIRYHYAAALARTGRGEEARALLADILLDEQGFDGRADAERLLASLGGM